MRFAFRLPVGMMLSRKGMMLSRRGAPELVVREPVHPALKDISAMSDPTWTWTSALALTAALGDVGEQ